MNSCKVLILTALLSQGICPLSLAANSPNDKPVAQLYRYINDKGTTVTSSKIPPEYAKKGYKIVSPSGLVLEEVAPELSEEERKKLNASQLSQVEQREKDKALLLRYSQLGELIQARDRKISELENKITAESANVSAIQNQIKSEQEKAANVERSGKPVPDYTLKKLKDLYHDQEVSEEHLTSLKSDLGEASKNFEEDIKRYEFLDNQRLKRQALPENHAHDGHP